MTKPCRFAMGLLFVTCVALVTPHARADQTLISDLEEGLGGWVFTNGPEFPGAQGVLTQTTGQDGGCARMTYDLSKGGNYVGATLQTPGLDADGLSLWLRMPATTKARIRVSDATGQTLQYDLLRTLEGSLDPSRWYPVLVNLGAPDTYYGGANDGIPHAPFASIGILAVPAIGATGFLEFDDVHAVLGPLELTVAPDSLPLLTAPSGAAYLSPRLAVNLHTTGNARALDLARDAGFSTVRLDLLWVHTERTRGVYNFQEFDGFVDSLARRGMRLHLILDYTNPLYPEVTDPDFSAVTIPAFAALARATAQHFAGKNLTYEIWNEPNSATYWPPEAGARLFAELCDAAVKAVHAGDPDALVTTGGLSGIDFDFIQTLIAHGGADSANAIGVHPYRRGGGESVGHDLVLLQSLVNTALAAPLPIWDTEWGYSSAWEGNGHGADARARQAQLVTRELLSAWAIGFPLVVYYDLNDGGTDATTSDHNFGLLTPDNSDKPAIVAVRTLSNAAKARRYAGLLQTASGSVHALRLDGSDDVAVVLWTDDASRDTLVHLPSNATATDYLGNPLTLRTNTSGADLTLVESAGPVYVTVATPSSQGGGNNAGGGAAGTAGAAGANATGGLGTTSGSASRGGTSTATGGASRGGSSTVRGGGPSAQTGGASSNGAGSPTGGASSGNGASLTTAASAASGGASRGAPGGSGGVAETGHTTTVGGAPRQPGTLENAAATTMSGCSCSTLPASASSSAWVWAASVLSLMIARRRDRSARRR